MYLRDSKAELPLRTLLSESSSESNSLALFVFNYLVWIGREEMLWRNILDLSDSFLLFLGYKVKCFSFGSWCTCCIAAFSSATRSYKLEFCSLSSKNYWFASLSFSSHSLSKVKSVRQSRIFKASPMASSILDDFDPLRSFSRFKAKACDCLRATLMKPVQTYWSTTSV